MGDVPTIKVWHFELNGWFWINEVDFDESRHALEMPDAPKTGDSDEKETEAAQKVSAKKKRGSR